jgi:hypothetical protein
MEPRDNLRTSHAILPLGGVTITTSALEVLTRRGVDPVPLLERHRAGDWGDAEREYAVLNDQALWTGGEVVSIYDVEGARFRVTTEIKAVTRVALLEEQ